MNGLEQLEPRAVFGIFGQICAIPHGSGNTAALSDWCVGFARARGLEASQDAAGNVLVRRPASAGREAAAPVILQAHLDMVCQKEPGCGLDMRRQGIEPAVDGDWVYARGTTLGGDDGIGAALALALAADRELSCPPLEVLLTTDEERGMTGCAALDASVLRGRRMINLDSEDEGVFTAGCAGGCVVRCLLPIAREPFAGTRMTVAAEGGLGGHSGGEIGRGRASANQVLGRVLWTLRAQTPLRLVSLSGGEKHNAIARSAAAELAASDPAAVRAAAAALDAALREEYRLTDPGLHLTVREGCSDALPMTAEASGRAADFLFCAPQGVQAMCAEIPGLVETSLNLGALSTSADGVSAEFCVRSMRESRKRLLTDRLRCLSGRLGGTVTVGGDYPPWEYRADSPLRELLVRVYREQWGRDPRVNAVHGGVECGLLAGKLPGLDCVSLGPDMREIHTPREKLGIASVGRVWELLRQTLRRIT